MPRIRPTPSENRRKKLTARIQYHMTRLGYDNKKMAKVLGVSEKTFYSKKYSPDKFSLEDVWNMESAFGCKLSEPVSVD